MGEPLLEPARGVLLDPATRSAIWSPPGRFRDHIADLAARAALEGEAARG